MSQKEKKNVPIVLLVLGLVGIVVLLFIAPQLSWIPLPFFLTGLAQTLDAI